jgi:hypothetical protein
MRAKPDRPTSPLAALNAHIERVSGVATRGTGHGSGSAAWPELRSAQRFRETWERLSAEVQVQQARERAPQNAGPLNPQRLMIENLARMGELSPHYLRRFLAHAETLLWLEQAQVALRKPAAAPAGERSAKSLRPRR